MTSLFLTIAVAALIYMHVWFLLSVILKRNDVADTAWGLGFVLLSWLAWTQSAHSARALLANVLVTVWGLRLAWHVTRRNWGKPEDRRYAEWRATWHHVYLRSYAQVFLLQGLFLYLILLPVLRIHAAPVSALGALDVLGALVWIAGFLCESLADAQLRRFLSQPANKGKLMQSGLWAYSRHPNYFGEVTQWWGIWLLALSVPLGSITIISPLLITFLILFVSGVPLLEQKYAGRPDFEAYKQRTSMFIPLPPRK